MAYALIAGVGAPAVRVAPLAAGVLSTSLAILGRLACVPARTVALGARCGGGRTILSYYRRSCQYLVNKYFVIFKPSDRVCRFHYNVAQGGSHAKDRRILEQGMDRQSSY